MTPSPPTPPPDRTALRADLFLLLAAAIWGSGFVAQREISQHLGSLGFNAARNVIALLALTPFLLRRGSRARQPGPPHDWRLGLAAGAATGTLLFFGGWIQQAGIARTTAGNAGFVTGLYVIFVPLFAALLGARLPRTTWFAALLALSGMYLLSASERWTLGPGDVLVLISALVWAVHVHAVGHFATRLDGLRLTAWQLAFGVLWSVPFASLAEPVSWPALRASGWPLVYSGVVCGAFAFTLQIAGQRHAPPSHAALLMSLEAVFAALFGAWLLGERYGLRGLAGAALMLLGMLVSQWPQLRPGKPA